MKAKALTITQELSHLRFRLKACDARRRVLLDVLEVVGCLDAREHGSPCPQKYPCLVCAALAKERAAGDGS